MVKLGTMVTLMVALTGVCLADMPMPVCGCIELERCGSPPWVDLPPLGEEFPGVWEDAPVDMRSFAINIDAPYSSPVTGWQCGSWPDGAEVTAVAYVYEISGVLNIEFNGLECCDSAQSLPNLPLYNGGVALQWVDVQDGYGLYVGNVDGFEYWVIFFEPYWGGRIMSIREWNEDMVTEYWVYQPPEPYQTPGMPLAVD